MSLDAAAELLVNPTFVTKVNLATTVVAEEVANEISTSDNASYYAKRADLATTVLRSPMSFQDTFVRMCATDDLINAAGVMTNDEFYLARVRQGWNAVAGVSTNEIPTTK